jgi:drug/metabolite transporter (DMT)-like permease
MPDHAIALITALLCAMCNGAAAMLQKIGADREQNATYLDAGLLVRLFQNKPYVAGITIDLIGWIFSLYALQYLPIFLVASVISASIIVTALLEKLFLRINIPKQAYLAMVAVVIGLVVLGITAAPTRAEPINDPLMMGLVLAPFFIGLLGYVIARRKSYRSACALAVLSGLAFGTTSVVARALDFSRPFMHLVFSPMTFVLISSTGLGILLFATALQRTHATVMNAFMSVTQTLVPAAVGLVFLGDSARNGMEYLVVIGSLLVLGGVIHLALELRLV